MSFILDKIHEFESIVGKENVSAGQLENKLYSRDLWPASLVSAMDEIRGIQKSSHWQDAVYTGGISQKTLESRSQLIVWPENESQVVELVKLCAKHKIPLIPYGAGSGVTGGTTPIKGGVILDLKKMDRIIDVNDEALLVRVQPGMNGQLFEEALNRKGLTLGHFPSSIYVSTVGGWVATRAAGQLSTLYGKIEDMVISLRVVLGTGEIVETLAAPKMAMGIDFNQVFIGSEGTLGVITEISFQVRPYPKHRLFRAIQVDGVSDGIDFMRRVMRAGLTPAATRLYDEIDTLLIGSGEGKTESKDEASNFVMERLKALKDGEGISTMLRFPRAINSLISLGSSMPFMGCLLVFTFEGEEELNAAQDRVLKRLIKEAGVKDLGPERAENWWNHRYKVSFNTPPIYKSGCFADTCEVSTDWSRLSDLYFKVKRAVAGEAFVMAHFSHSYVTGGNIYFSFVGTGRNQNDLLKRYFRCWDRLMKVCIQEKAALSHHHGVGHLKGIYMKEQLGGLFPMFEALKKEVDPNNILNPGKLGLALK